MSLENSEETFNSLHHGNSINFTTGAYFNPSEAALANDKNLILN